jgi:hypothetical protein
MNCGVGVLMLLSAATPQFMDWFFASLAVFPIVGWVALRLIAKRSWKGASWFAVSFTAVFLVHRVFGGHVTAVALMYFIVGLTWVSGLGYLFSVGELRGRGRVQPGEIVRLLTSIALPAVAVLAQSRPDAPSWALICLVAFELAHGGLDNLLAHHHADDSATRWGARVGAEIALLVAVYLAPTTVAARGYDLAALVVATIGLVVAFVQKRRFYLDEAPARPAKAAAPKPAAAV